MDWYLHYLELEITNCKFSHVFVGCFIPRSIATMWQGWWGSVCLSCFPHPSWRTQRWGRAPSWPTLWVCSSRRPTSSETTWRIRSRDVPSGLRRWVSDLGMQVLFAFLSQTAQLCPHDRNKTNTPAAMCVWTLIHLLSAERDWEERICGL